MTFGKAFPEPVLVNDPDETATAAAIARAAFGDEAVMYPGPSYLGSEDFAFMLQKKRGTYCLLGNGDTPMVHHPDTCSTTRFLRTAPHTG